MIPWGGRLSHPPAAAARAKGAALAAEGHEFFGVAALAAHAQKSMLEWSSNHSYVAANDDRALHRIGSATTAMIHCASSMTLPSYFSRKTVSRLLLHDGL